jgi:HlyD family secretion protein
MRELAAEQLVPLTRVRALERTLAELDGRRAQLGSLIATTQQQRSGEQRDVDAQLAEVLPQLAAVRQRLENTRMRAPTEGVVVGLTAHTVGGVISPGERVMEIVPRNQDLVIEASVRPEDADDLEPGQRTEVRIPAFHGRNLPIVYGEVRQISADRFTDERTGNPYFRAQIVVSPEQLQRLTEASDRQLRPGLPAQIVVPTRSRTALEYLVEPLNQALWRSMREE